MREPKNTALILLAFSVLATIVVVSVVREVRFARLERRYAELNTRMMDGIRANAAGLEAVRNAIPQRPSSGPPQSSGTPTTPAAVDRIEDPLAFFRAVDLLIDERNRRHEARARATLVENESFRTAIEAAGLHVETGDRSEIHLHRGDRRYFSITITDSDIELRSAGGLSVRESSFGPVSAAFVAAESANPEQVTVEPTGPAPPLAGAPSAPPEPPAQEGPTPLDLGRRRVEQIITDNGFTALLANRELTVAPDARESAHFVYYDLLTTGGASLGAFAVQRTTGDIWLVDDEDVPIMSLRRASAAVSERQPIRVPASTDVFGDSPGARGMTVLLLGINEDVTDSIMLAHVAPKTESIHFFSLPRDLYYRGIRINGIYSRYGFERMAAEIGTMTGLPVDRTIAVDMYAFIDLVNILGGVTIDLEEELIDPTYRVRDDGVWSTLYYPPGRHHLSGIAALRIARSRFTTTDFGRSRRQQDIINAIREKLAGMGMRDIGTIQTLVYRMLEYVETDFTAVDALRAIARYGRYSNSTHHVLSTDNVLYSTWTALHFRGLTEDDVDDDYDRGAWILLPHDGNWDLIRWYVRTAIDEGTVDLEWLRIAGYLTDPQL